MKRYQINTTHGILCFVMATDERHACKVARKHTLVKREITAHEVTKQQYLNICIRSGFMK